MQWMDEKELVVVSLIASILFMTVLDLALGVIYTGMIIVYYIFMKEPWSYQFSRDRKYFSPSILIIAIIGVMAYYLIADVLHLPIQTYSLIGFSITDIALTNPILKSLIWIFFISLAETLFFFGILFGYIRYKSKKAGIITYIVFGVMIALFHILSQKMTQETLLIDMIFGTISGVTVVKYNELKYAYYIHLIANLIGIYMIGGLAWLLL